MYHHANNAIVMWASFATMGLFFPKPISSGDGPGAHPRACTATSHGQSGQCSLAIQTMEAMIFCNFVALRCEVIGQLDGKNMWQHIATHRRRVRNLLLSCGVVSCTLSIIPLGHRNRGGLGLRKKRCRPKWSLSS